MSKYVYPVAESGPNSQTANEMIVTQLVVRAWRCSACGTEHERDVNAALKDAPT